MYRKLLNLSRSSTVRQTAITSFSTFASAGLGAFYYLLVAKSMGVESYGLFALSLQIMLTLAPIADLGTGNSLVRFIGEKSSHMFHLTSAAFRVKLVSATFFALVLLAGSSFIANQLLRQPRLLETMPLVAVGIIIIVLFYFVVSVLQGYQNFVKWGAVQIGANLIRIILLLLVVLLGFGSSFNAIFVFVIAFAIALAYSFKWIDKRHIISPVSGTIMHQFWQFNRWTALFAVTSALTGRIDSFLAARYLEISQLGVYSLALIMSSFLPMVAMALGAVTGPKLSSMNSKKDVSDYLSKSVPFSVAVSLLVGLAMIPVAFVVTRFTGNDYHASFTPFLILLTGMFIFSALTPIRDTLMYAYSKPRLSFFSTLIQGITVLTVGRMLIPQYAVVGAAVATVAGQIAFFVFTLLAYHQIKKTVSNS